MAFPEGRFQCVTVCLQLPRSHQLTPPSPSPPLQTWHLQRFSAHVAKYMLLFTCPEATKHHHHHHHYPHHAALNAKYTSQDGIESDDDCFADNEEDEFNTDPFDKNRDSGDSEDEVYT